MAHFTYLGGMCVLVEREDGFKILCDPYFAPGCGYTPEQFYDVDLILVSHAAFDHYGSLNELMENGHATLIAAGDTRRILCKAVQDIDQTRLLRTVHGDRRIFGETVVRPVYAMHVSASNPEGVHVNGVPYGFVVQVEKNVCYYHTGDTYLFSDMKLLRELYHPNVMVVGISAIGEGFPCEMTPREAAIAAAFVGAQVIIPSHYVPGSAALEEFMQCMAIICPDTVVKSGIGRTFQYRPYSCEDVRKI